MPIPDSLLRFEATFDGAGRAIVLRRPSVLDIVPLILDEDIRSVSIVEATLALELQFLVESVDGEEYIDEDVARRIARDPETLAVFLQARNRLYDHLAGLGRVWARCPGCGDREIEADLLFYWTTLKLPAWSFFDRGVLMRVPSLASRIPLGQRPPDVPLAASIRFAYPEPETGGLLRAVAPPLGIEAEEAAWRRWVDSVEQQPDERSHWRRSSPGFRSILRLAVALGVSPEEVEALPLGAFLFLDLLHFALANVDVPGPGRAVLACPGCGYRFLPFLG